MKFSAIPCDAACIILTAKQKFNGETTKTRRGKCLESNLSGVAAGHPSTLAGQCFSGVVR